MAEKLHSTRNRNLIIRTTFTFEKGTDENLETSSLCSKKGEGKTKQI